VEALRRMGPAALPEVERAFTALAPEVRRLLVDLVGRIEDRRASRLLLAALADLSPEVRAEAALALGDGAYLDALRPLMSLKSTDPSADVRRAAPAALRKLQPR
jgi:HEAT repeat protein